MMHSTALVAFVGIAAAMAMSGHASLASTDNGPGVYDSVNNVTWTADAQLFYTQAGAYPGGAVAFVNAVIAASGGIIHDTPNIYDTPANSGNYNLSAGDFDTVSGKADWWGTQAWVCYLNITNYGGSNQWVLPTTVNNNTSMGSPNGAPGNPAQSSSQLAQLFYGGLGQVAATGIQETHNASYALFSHRTDDLSWSATEYLSTYNAWVFETGGTQSGFQGTDPKTVFSRSLPAVPGQIVSAGNADTDGPIPLWGIGALGATLLAIASRRRRMPL